MDFEFLTLDDVLLIHADQIDRYGGTHGVRDHGLLASAVQMPRAGFGGQLFHEDIYQMAAAYLFHIVQNHPFLDGNKRAGAASAITFLRVNGLQVADDQQAMIDLVLSVAEGRTEKDRITAFFRTHCRDAPPLD